MGIEIEVTSLEQMCDLMCGGPEESEDTCPDWKKTEDPCEEHIRKALRAALRRVNDEEL